MTPNAPLCTFGKELPTRIVAFRHETRTDK